MIIDEFTGRILEGRRWSEGLHQAIEAKEGVRIREENQTLATITLQNYFRLYDKLAGMTGTAMTEANEFMKTYKMPVVEIPTNRDLIRADQNDQIYKTKDGKWKAVVKEVAERCEKGQPVLVGTISVEVSEMLSEQFKRQGIDHVVLNAKPENAEKEGETVAQAGRVSAVTIATNMAGRGVDIKLGGDPEKMAEGELRKIGVKPVDPNYEEELTALMPGLIERCAEEGDRVRELGGLFICGTERHESRRIDNQLRGRSGRQGDPGESRFFLSAEDDLVRHFAGDRIYRILDRLGPVDDDGEEYPLEAKMLTKQIANAQEKVEQQHYLSRKRVLEYDDVMNEQRRVVYRYRREVLEGKDMGEIAREQVAGMVANKVAEFTQSDVFEEWDLGGLDGLLRSLWPLEADLSDLDPVSSSRESVTEMLIADAMRAYDAREAEFGAELMRAVERHILLQIIDQRWKEHLHEMDYLREGIHLRGFAQIDPLVAYKNEGFLMFEALMDQIWEEYARLIFHVEVEVTPPEPQPEAEAAPKNVSYSGGTEAEAVLSAAAGGAVTATAAPRRLPWRALRARATGAPMPRPSSRTSRRTSAVTIPAGAAAARSTRSATGPSGRDPRRRRDPRRQQLPARACVASRPAAGRGAGSPLEGPPRDRDRRLPHRRSPCRRAGGARARRRGTRDRSRDFRVDEGRGRGGRGRDRVRPPARRARAPGRACQLR